MKTAQQWLQQMTEASVPPNEVSYTTFINHCAKRGDIDGANHWFKEIRAADLRPNALSYTCMIRSYTNCGKTDNALVWFDNMFQACIAPDAVTYGLLIDAFAKEANYKSANGMMMRMRSASLKPNAIVYTSLLKACARSLPQLRGEAETHFRDMVRSNVRLDAIVLQVLDSVVGRERRSRLCRELRVDEERIANSEPRKRIDRRGDAKGRLARERSR